MLFKGKSFHKINIAWEHGGEGIQHLLFLQTSCMLSGYNSMRNSLNFSVFLLSHAQSFLPAFHIPTHGFGVFFAGFGFFLV